MTFAGTLTECIDVEGWSALPLLAFLAGADAGAVIDDVCGTLTRLYRLQEPERKPPLLACAAGADAGAVSDDVRGGAH